MRYFSGLLNINIFWFVPLSCAIACLLCVSAILFFIFKPAKPVYFLGIKIQGLVFAKQNTIRNSIVNRVTELILSKKETIHQSVASPENVEKIIPQIETHIQEFLTVRLPKDLPMIAMFLGEKTTHQIKEVFMKELRELFPKVITQYFDKMIDEKKLRDMISNQFSDSSETLMITAFQEKSKPLFLKIKIFAFVFGLIIGIILTIISSLFT